MACGPNAAASYEDSHSAKQIVNDASSSTGSATSYHITINGTTQNGQGTVDFDVSGSNVQGTVKGQAMSLRLIHVNGQSFVNGADLAALLEKTDAQAATIVKAKASDKWVLMPSTFWSSTTMNNTIDMQKMSTCLKGATGLKKKGTSTISDQKVVEVDDQQNAKIFVQTSAPHYYTRVSFAGGDPCVTDSSVSDETIDLTKVGQKMDIAVPSGYVDLQTLASGA